MKEDQNQEYPLTKKGMIQSLREPTIDLIKRTSTSQSKDEQDIEAIERVCQTIENNPNSVTSNSKRWAARRHV